GDWLHRREQGDLLASDEAEQCRQQGFQADGAKGRLGERQSLVFRRLRIVSGDHGVNGATPQTVDQGKPVSLRSERWLNLAVGKIVADIEFVEEQRVGCD